MKYFRSATVKMAINLKADFVAAYGVTITDYVIVGVYVIVEV